MKTRLFLGLILALGLGALHGPALAQPSSLLQSSCFQASFGRAGLRAGGATIAAAEIEWFDATHHIVSEDGSLTPGADEESRRAVAALGGTGAPGRRFLAAQLTVRLRGEPEGEGPETDGALCTPADRGLRCHLFCAGAGEFTVRLDRQGRAEVRPGPTGTALNRCSGTRRAEVRFAPGSRPAFALKPANNDACGSL